MVHFARVSPTLAINRYTHLLRLLDIVNWLRVQCTISESIICFFTTKGKQTDSFEDVVMSCGVLQGSIVGP